MWSKCIVRTVSTNPSTAIDDDVFHTIRSTFLFVDVMYRHYPGGEVLYMLWELQNIAVRGGWW